MMIIELPVAPYAPPEQIRGWIEELESMREDPDAEPSDLRRIQQYLTTARGWLENAHQTRGPESGNAASPVRGERSVRPRPLCKPAHAAKFHGLQVDPATFPNKKHRKGRLLPDQY